MRRAPWGSITRPGPSRYFGLKFCPGVRASYIYGAGIRRHIRGDYGEGAVYMGSRVGEDILEPPEAWARGFLEYVGARLQAVGFRGLEPPYSLVYSALAAGHLTGLDYFYEYAIEAYYELMDVAEEARPLAEPRWARLLPYLDEDAEALAAFEERLADSKTVLCAEPVLAAALLGLAAGKRPSRRWYSAGFTGRPGSYPLLARRGDRKCRILVPSPIYVLAIAALERLGLKGPGVLEAAVPDPAMFRKTVFDAKVPYEELSSWLRRLAEDWARKSLEVDDPCSEENSLKIRYRFDGVLEAEFTYLC